MNAAIFCLIIPGANTAMLTYELSISHSNFLTSRRLQFVFHISFFFRQIMLVCGNGL